MALTDILTHEGTPMQYDMARGDTGSVEDLQSRTYNTFEIPEQTGSGGSIFIMSE